MAVSWVACTYKSGSERLTASISTGQQLLRLSKELAMKPASKLFSQIWCPNDNKVALDALTSGMGAQTHMRPMSKAVQAPCAESSPCCRGIPHPQLLQPCLGNQYPRVSCTQYVWMTEKSCFRNNGIQAPADNLQSDLFCAWRSPLGPGIGCSSAVGIGLIMR